MSSQDIIRAWKDQEYRQNLNEEQLSKLPENPAGIVDLSHEDMEVTAGGFYSASPCTYTEHQWMGCTCK